MATPLSIHNLMHGGWRSVLSVVGISIAIILIFMQLGFLGAVTDTAVVFYDEMDFDLVASSPDYYTFVDSGRFSRHDLHAIESHPAVQKVGPLHVCLGKWNYEAKEVQRGMLVMGIDPNTASFKNPGVNELRESLQRKSAMAVDRTSRPRFLGAENRKPFDESQIGLQVELNGVACQLVGLFDIGTGLAADGAMIVNENLFKDLVPGYTNDDVGIGLIRLKPGVDPEVARESILQMFPKISKSGDQRTIDVLTRNELESREIAYWQWGTPIGFIFLAGSIVAFLVGAIIVYIVLSSDIAKQMGEYATLKAMGYRNSFLFNTVMEQAFILAIISYVCALGISLVLYHVVGDLANLPIMMTGFRLLLVLGSSLLMSFISASIAMQKLRQADPADLF